MAYTLSGTGIIHELLGDEVIVANLDAGIYYSLRDSGVLIWQLLLAGHSISSIESLFSKKYGQPIFLSDFIKRLENEGLLVTAASSSSSLPTLFWPAVFNPPVFERYDEMKNLLMLDPIHEVDEQGWPHQK